MVDCPPCMKISPHETEVGYRKTLVFMEHEVVYIPCIILAKI